MAPPSRCHPTTLHWRVLSGGKILLESKDEVRKRIGRSTDDGDAVTMAFFEEFAIAARQLVRELAAWISGGPIPITRSSAAYGQQTRTLQHPFGRQRAGMDTAIRAGH
jgi:hypothetical protein